jgi:hypothetical protein
MGTEQEQLRRQIDLTRDELGSDVDTLADRVSPKRVIGRKVESARSTAGGWGRSVMGAPSSAASGLTDLGSDSASAIRDRAEGNPMAAGLVTFGAAWLISSLIPSSRSEQQAVEAANDFAQQHGQPVKDELQRAASEGAQAVRDDAQRAASEVRQSAEESMETIRQA